MKAFDGIEDYKKQLVASIESLTKEQRDEFNQVCKFLDEEPQLVNKTLAYVMLASAGNAKQTADHNFRLEVLRASVTVLLDSKIEENIANGRTNPAANPTDESRREEPPVG